MATTVNYRFVVKRDTAANFAIANTLLLQGEWALEVDTLQMKMGDGTTPWNSLAYFTLDGGGAKIPTALIPAQIPGLAYWFDASIIALPAGSAIMQMPSPDPYRQLNYALADSGPTSSIAIAAAQLNALNVAQLSAASSGNGTLGFSYTLAQGTILFVANPTSGDLIGGKATAAANIEYDATNHKWSFASTNVAVIGSGSNASAPLSTWKQANVSWNTTTWAWRTSSAADTSGSASISITTPTNALFYQGSTVNTNNLSGKVAEVIAFVRKLTLTEIQGVEAYFLAKWGV